MNGRAQAGPRDDVRAGDRPAPQRRNARYTPLAVDGPLPADMVRAVPAIRRDPLAFLERTVRLP